MPDRLPTGDFHWAESDVTDGPRAGQALRQPIIPWFDSTWGGARDDAVPQNRAGFSELPLLVVLAILSAGLPGEAALSALALTVAVFAAIGRRPLNPGVVRGLIWLYRPLVLGELLLWWTNWGSTESTGPVLGDYALIVLLACLLVAVSRRVWAHARPA